MDGERFDKVARVWAADSRRHLFAGITSALLATLAGVSAAKHSRDKRLTDRRQTYRAKQGKRAENGPERALSSDGCAGVGAACAADAGCCSGRCEQQGACRRKKKKGKKKKKILTGACRCAETSCVPDNLGACAGKQCGNAINNCGTTISCGSCAQHETCPAGACICESPFTACGGSCVNLNTDDDHCGSCDIACSGSASCQDGSCPCVPSCAGKQCGSDGCNGSCGTCSDGKSCRSGMCGCAVTCCPRRYNSVNCQCVEKGPLTLSLVPNSASVAKDSTVDLTVRLDMFQDSHLPSLISFGLSFNAAVLEPVSIQLTSATAAWQELESTLQAGFAGISIGAGSNPTNVLQHSADVLVVRLRAIGNSGASTAVTFSDAEVLSISECDTFSENVADAVVNGTVTVA